MGNLRAELAKTNKKGLNCACIFDENGKYINTILQRADGTYNLHAYTGCSPIHGDEKIEREFIDQYLLIMEKQKATAEEHARKEREFEENRVAVLKSQIMDCSTPRELTEYFDLSTVDSANHWNELHTGKSRFGVKITSAAEAEILELAKERFKFEGEYVELKNRAGEHHWVPSSSYYDLEDYQQKAKTWLYNQNNFKSQATEEEFLLEQIKESDSLENVRQLLNKHDDLEPGLYDHNDSLLISEEEYESKNFSGYREDVYCFQFGFVFEMHPDNNFED